MKGKVIFRRAIFGGLNKQDVMEYVDSLEYENEKLQIEMNKKTDQLMAQIAALEEKLSNAGDPELTVQLKAQLRDSQALQREYRKKLELANKRSDDLKSQLMTAQTRGPSKADLEKAVAERTALIQKNTTKIISEQKLQAQNSLVSAKKRTEVLVNQLKGRIAELENAVSEQTEKSNYLKKRAEMLVKKLNGQIAELENSVSEQTEKSASLQNILDEKELQIEQLRQEMAELQSMNDAKDEFVEETLDEEIAPECTEVMSDLDSIFASTMESLDKYEQMANKKVISIVIPPSDMQFPGTPSVWK